MIINEKSTHKFNPVKRSYLYENLEILESEFELLNTLKKPEIIEFINKELNILKLLHFKPSPDIDRNTLLSIYFLFIIFSNLIENLSKDYKTSLNWKDLFYFSLMESPSPESFIKNTIKEIKRKRSFNSTIYLNAIINQKIKDNLVINSLIKSKQMKLDKFL